MLKRDNDYTGNVYISLLIIPKGLKCRQTEEVIKLPINVSFKRA